MGKLVDGQHRISLNVVGSPEHPFYFDSIEYTPSNNVSLSQATVKFPHLDPDINFGPGWIDAPYRRFEKMGQTPYILQTPSALK